MGQGPACGIYRTSSPLVGHEEQVPAEVLVYFHNHSDAGPALVLLPESNENNLWTFHDRGFLVRGEEAAAFIGGLVALPAQGFYVVKEHVHLDESDILALRELLC